MLIGYFPRALEGAVKRAARSFPAVVVTGPRQSGKTSLLRQLFEASHRYTSLDDADAHLFATSDPRAFIEDHPPPAIFDEIQRAPQLLRHIKSEIDHHRQRYGQYLLTGSQTFALMGGVSESLAGRAAILHLLPLSVRESPDLRVPPVKDRATYARWVLAGSFPEIHHRLDLDVHTWYASYIQTYLERDVRTLANVGNLLDFHRMLRLLAARTGSIVNLSWLARDLGVAVNTVKSWLSVLEGSGVILLRPAYYESLGKRISKSPRLHFLDPGSVAHLTGLQQANEVLAGPLAGSLFETFVAGELAKLQAGEGQRPTIYHWRTYSGEEVDLVVEFGGKVHGIECKLAATVSDRDIQPLKLFQAALPPSRRGIGLLVCTAPSSGRLGDVRIVTLDGLRRATSFADLVKQ